MFVPPASQPGTTPVAPFTPPTPPKPWERVSAGRDGYLNAALSFLATWPHTGARSATATTEEVHEAVGAGRGMPQSHSFSGLLELEAFGLVFSEGFAADGEHWRITTAGQQALSPHWTA